MPSQFYSAVPLEPPSFNWYHGLGLDDDVASLSYLGRNVVALWPSRKKKQDGVVMLAHLIRMGWWMGGEREGRVLQKRGYVMDHVCQQEVHRRGGLHRTEPVSRFAHCECHRSSSDVRPWY